MNTETPNLKIRIHKLDRSILSFVQNDVEAAKQILEGFDPAKIFNRPRIIIGEKNSYTVISVPQITRIDLEMHPASPLSILTNLVEATELRPAEFAALDQNHAVNDQWGAFLGTYLNLELADARNVLLTMDLGSPSPRGVGGLRDFLLSRSGLSFRASDGGVSALNLANLSRLTILPGAHQPDYDVRLAVRCGEILPAKPEETRKS